MNLLITVGLLALTACGPSFYDVQKQDTIEAYESWLEANPKAGDAIKAKLRLEELYLEKARAEKSLAAFDAVLTRFPDGVLKEKVLAERETFLYDAAVEADTVAAWQAYLDEYPRGNKKQKQEARRRIKVLGYTDKWTWGPLSVKPINLAEDPTGPLNGWEITSEFSNKGDKTITYLDVELIFTAEDGRFLDRKRWPLVAERFPVPVEEEYKVPIMPGEQRTYVYTTESPEGWTLKPDAYDGSGAWDKLVALNPVALRLEGEESAEQ